MPTLIYLSEKDYVKLSKPSESELLAIIDELKDRIKQLESRESTHNGDSSYTPQKALVDSSDDAIISKDVDGFITSWNSGAEKLYGYSAEEMIGKHITSIIPDDFPNEMPEIIERLRRGERIQAHDGVRVHKSGRLLNISLSISPIKDENGEIIGASTISRDLSELAYMMSIARCLLWYADIEEIDNPVYLKWTINIPNQEGAQKFLPLQMEPGESYAKAWYRHRDPGDRDACDKLGTQSVREGNSYSQEFRCFCADGTIRWLHEDIRVNTIEPGKKWRAVGVCTDITEQRQMEQQLLQAQKMEGLGRLAGGIAHDFNNLLTAIMGYVELAEEAISEESPIRNYLSNTSQAAERAAELTKQLLVFARKQVTETKVISLNELVLDLEKMLRRLIGEDIDFEVRLSPDIGAVKVDPSQLAQVIINLAVNSRDAMPNGGRLLIETANMEFDHHYCAAHPEVKPGKYVMVSISDTGTGMSAEVLKHAFEPFFTTKEQGRGTGLGLATSHGIINQAGGHIWVYSEENIGTTFKIYLPMENMPLDDMVEVTRGKLPMGTETILLVEDEPLVRGLAVQILRAQGFKVIDAKDGEEALELSQSYQGVIHLCVTDVVMPKMGGKELAEQLVMMRPEIKIMFASGYTDETVMQHGVLERGVEFLQKPYTLALLTRRVREVLDKNSHPEN